MTTKLTHPDAPKAVVESSNPEALLSQGWVKAADEKPAAEKPDPK